MGDDWSSVRRVHGPDASEELQERRRMLGDAVIRPGGVLELLHLAAVSETHLRRNRSRFSQVDESGETCPMATDGQTRNRGVAEGQGTGTGHEGDGSFVKDTGLERFLLTLAILITNEGRLTREVSCMCVSWARVSVRPVHLNVLCWSSAYIDCTHALELEGANCVGSQLLRVRQGHRHHPVVLRAPHGPILITFYPGRRMH